MTDTVRQRERVLDGLDPEQQAAVLAAPGPVCILAGAGTGKTRTITRRIAYLAVTGQVNPSHVLAVTHSHQAARELRHRVQSLGVSVHPRTFHSAAMSQLRYFWAKTGLPGDELEMVHEKRGRQSQLLGDALKAVGQSDVQTSDVRELGAEIEWARSRRLTPSGYAAAAAEAGRRRGLPADTLANAFERYEHLKRTHGVLDFSDTIEQCALLLEQSNTVAGKFRDQYRCIVVDEYQDTDPAQERLLAAWLGSADNVTVVGDPHQAIYSFKGADPSLLAGFAGRYPDTVSISLTRDYRSTPQIVGAANRLMAHASAGVVLEGQRPAGPEPIRHSFDSEAVEAAELAARVDELIAEGVTPSEIAVLVRTNHQIDSYRTALQKAGVVIEVLDNERGHRAEAERAPRSSGGVRLATMHSAKGLEWDVVLLPGLTEGFLPIVHATSPEEIEEERRLLYVAVTRARERLELSYALHSDKGRLRQPSRFLSQIFPRKNRPATTAAPTPSPYSAGKKAHSTAFGVGRVTEVGTTGITIDFGSLYGVRTISPTSPDLSPL